MYWYIPVCTEYILACTHWVSTYSYVLFVSSTYSYMLSTYYNNVVYACLYKIQLGTYHAIVWYCYKPTETGTSLDNLGIYHLVQLVTILANSAFQSKDQYIQSNWWYALVHTLMNRALLWKAEFARIVTSCTRWYTQVCTGLYRFIAVPYNSMVCTAMELCCHYHNWVYTISCHVLKIKVNSLNSMYRDKPGTYQYVLRQTWYIQLQIPEQNVLR